MEILYPLCAICCCIDLQIGSAKILQKSDFEFSMLQKYFRLVKMLACLCGIKFTFDVLDTISRLAWSIIHFHSPGFWFKKDTVEILLTVNSSVFIIFPLSIVLSFGVYMFFDIEIRRRVKEVCVNLCANLKKIFDCLREVFFRRSFERMPDDPVVHEQNVANDNV